MVALLKQMHLQNDTGLYALYATISDATEPRRGKRTADGRVKRRKSGSSSDQRRVMVSFVS